MGIHIPIPTRGKRAPIQRIFISQQINGKMAPFHQIFILQEIDLEENGFQSLKVGANGAKISPACWSTC